MEVVMAMGGGLPTDVNDGWFDIIKEAARKSSEEEPFVTFLLVLVAAVIIPLTGTCLTYRYYAKKLESNERIEFERIRLTSNV